MNLFSRRLVALALTLGVLGAAAVLSVDVYASPTTATKPDASTALTSSTQAPDQVIQWNRILLGILQTPGAQPATVHATRSMAILHAAVYDAVNAIVKTHTDYLVHLEAPRHASVAAAAATAAHDVLVKLYPAQAVTLDGDLAASFATVPNGSAKEQGIRVGSAAAAKLVALRVNDGSAAAPLPFTPGTSPGDYQLTPPGFRSPSSPIGGS